MIDSSGHDIHHDNIAMGIFSVLLSIVGAISVEEMTGHVIHWISIAIGAVLAFLVQKGMHHIWDRYVTKTKKTDV